MRTNWLLSFLLLAGACRAQALVWTFTEQQTLTCGRTPHPSWDPAQYLPPPPRQAPTPTISTVGGGFTLTWQDFTAGQVALLLLDHVRLPVPWTPMVYVLPTFTALGATTVIGTVAFNWQLPATLPLSVVPAGVHYLGAGQVVALCPGTVQACESSYTFDVWCQR